MLHVARKPTHGLKVLVMERLCSHGYLESRCSCTLLKERDPGEPPAKHCGETAVLPGTGGAGTGCNRWLL